ncbi:hypothetical protein Tco_0532577 [Tanacetum coccineum]
MGKIVKTAGFAVILSTRGNQKKFYVMEEAKWLCKKSKAKPEGSTAEGFGWVGYAIRFEFTMFLPFDAKEFIKREMVCKFTTCPEIDTLPGPVIVIGERHETISKNLKTMYTSATAYEIRAHGLGIIDLISCVCTATGCRATKRNLQRSTRFIVCTLVNGVIQDPERVGDGGDDYEELPAVQAAYKKNLQLLPQRHGVGEEKRGQGHVAGGYVSPATCRWRRCQNVAGERVDHCSGYRIKLQRYNALDMCNSMASEMQRFGTSEDDDDDEMGLDVNEEDDDE